MNDVIELYYKTLKRLFDITREGIKKALESGFIREEKMSKYLKRNLKRRKKHGKFNYNH